MSTEHIADRIVGVVALLAEGEVVSYGDVAMIAGHPRQSRLVGRLLQMHGDDLPWWRVVTSTGRLVPGAETEQAALLRREGVETVRGRVVAAPLGRFARCTPDR
ncbi:MAG: MGMT family protein [Ilumatobacteraceae bacterium]